MARTQAKVEEMRLNAAPKKERSEKQRANDALLAQRRRKTAPIAQPEAPKLPDFFEPAIRAVRAVGGKLGEAAVIKLLSKFGVGKVRELLPEQIESFVQFANSMLEVPHVQNDQPEQT